MDDVRDRDADLRELAIHEAGHALAWVVLGTLHNAEVHIEPEGATFCRWGNTNGRATQADIEVILAAGQAAEVMHHGGRCPSLAYHVDCTTALLLAQGPKGTDRSRLWFLPLAKRREAVEAACRLVRRPRAWAWIQAVAGILAERQGEVVPRSDLPPY